MPLLEGGRGKGSILDVLVEEKIGDHLMITKVSG